MEGMTTTDVPSGFNAFGHPVPWHRKAGALAHVREMAPGVSTEAATLNLTSGGLDTALVERVRMTEG